MSGGSAKKIVLITGCSPGGIGHALAQEFHTKGCHVIATARNKHAIRDLKEMGMDTLSLEVTSKESVQGAKGEVERITKGRGLDILVNNAGRNYTMPALDVDLDEARDCFETNLFAVISITQTFVPLLIQAKGTIVNIGSMAAIMPYVFGSVYNASKAALHAYSQTLRLELEPFGVSVMVIVTGGVVSRIARNKRLLPEESLYRDIAEDFQRRVSHSQEGAMGNEQYAAGVVRQVLRPKFVQRKWYWRGGKTWLVWFGRSFVGGWIFDLVLPRMFGLHKLARLVRSKDKRG